MGKIARTHILSINIGVMNMGIVEVEKKGNSRPRLLSGGKVDITDNGGCNGKSCELGHTNAMTDWVDHLLMYVIALQTAWAAAAWAAADTVLIERQPPLGFRDCEQLLFRAFRKKANNTKRPANSVLVQALEGYFRSVLVKNLCKSRIAFASSVWASKARSPDSLRKPECLPVLIFVWPVPLTITL